MDKYSGYVIVVYAVTLGLLLGYLLWMWWRLRSVQDEPLSQTVPLSEERR